MLTTNKFQIYTLNLLALILVVLGLLLCLNQIKSFNAATQYLNISATGKASTTPDIAVVTIGVMSQGVTALEATNANNQKINRVINFIKEQGINAKDIQTSNLYSTPRYDQLVITSYEANQTITVKVRNIDKSAAQLEKIISGAVANGANLIQGINFSIDDPEKLSQQARKQAIEKAKQQAIDIANDAGLKLGRVVNVILSNNYAMPMPYNMAAASTRAKAITPDIEPGTQEVTESVTLVIPVY